MNLGTLSSEHSERTLHLWELIITTYLGDICFYRGLGEKPGNWNNHPLMNVIYDNVTTWKGDIVVLHMRIGNRCGII